MRHGMLRYRWPVALVLTLVGLLVTVGIIAAQPPVPHAVMEGEDCLSCHQAGAAGAPRLAWDHLGRSNGDCAHCHEVSGAPAGAIPHTLVGREDCLSCHRDGVGATPKLSASHVDYVNDECLLCHLPAPGAAEPTPIPPAVSVPTPEVSPGPVGAESCASCHQLIFADEEHALFTGQPLGDPQVGAALFAQLCATCHGEDGTTPVGEEGSVINAQAYWSTHDDAAILQDIGIGSHGEMTAFAENYDGPLSWEEILQLASFVRSWGPLAVSPAAMPPEEGTTYTNAIGPLLTEQCGSCHGGIAGLSVTDYASLMSGALSGPVVIAGSPEESRIVEVQRDGHYAQLSEADLNLLIEWIAGGAPE
jgi:mono/diheme cytochrome c family protein